jgi:putative transcriptional regulator
MYHYTDCGLGNVYLLNGYREEDTPYGKTVFIDNIDELHKAMGIRIVRSTSDMLPEELRFLRVEMELSQKDLGRWLDVDAQTVARWEKGEYEIPGPAERLVRSIYLEFLKEDSGVRDLCERLADLDQKEHPESIHFQDVGGEWKIAA